jgi:hypothetical protein
MEFPLAPGFMAPPASEPIADAKSVSWNAFPNPSSGQLTVTYQSPKEQNTVLTLHSASGLLLLSKQVYLKRGANEIQWDISTAPNGIYFIDIKQGGISPLKIVKE